MASIAMRAAESAHKEYQALDPSFKVQQFAQFVASALIGNGVKNFETLTQLGIPVVIDAAHTGSTDDKLCTWGRALRHDAVDERVEKALSRICEERGRPMPDERELNSIKLRVGIIVTGHIREHGLFVYTQKLLFDPKFAEICMSVLKEMKLPDTGGQAFHPASASCAIANGLLPDLPSRTLKDHLLFLGALSMLGSGARGGRAFSEWVKENEPTLVEYPAPNLYQSRDARVDHYFVTARSRSAELGMGFFLASTKGQFSGQISIVSPVLFHTSGADDLNFRNWRVEFLKNQAVESLSRMTEEGERLRRAIKKGALLRVCPDCSEVYSDARDELKLRCNCARGR
ncbi:hypothetical protein PQR33_36110 [Paraburkholderia sediminicola]|uniref:hypothetical protein n=1 Tax=Paraburkholderia sediminicola TaxID=458836 RepID=UPI0038BBABAA